MTAYFDFTNPRHPAVPRFEAQIEPREVTVGELRRECRELGLGELPTTSEVIARGVAANREVIAIIRAYWGKVHEGRSS